MLPQKFRLAKSADIKRVLTRGRYRHLQSRLLVKWLPNRLAYPRLTVIVSKKVSKKAVERNRVNRVLLAVVTKTILTNPSSLDIVLIAKPGLFAELAAAKEELRNFINKQLISAKNVQ